jgi:predicted flap endonuclease-1-like 5' DNA nuclease
MAIASAIVWLTREHLLPAPHVPHEPPPHFRSTPPAPEPATDDLTSIKGIGPVYAARLADIGITTFQNLAAADQHTITEATNASASAIAQWISQAQGRIA